ncbi:TerC family protein, partial [Xanthomonas citri pv. citri]|nr:TerC family protein [Xanthomonas citri pv. citri]
RHRQEVLMVGIIIALIARAVFIAVGAVAIEHLTWVFYIFGFILVFTAGNLIKGEMSENASNEADNIVVRLARKLFHTTDY